MLIALSEQIWSGDSKNGVLKLTKNTVTQSNTKLDHIYKMFYASYQANKRTREKK